MIQIKTITLLSIVLVALSACFDKSDDFANAKKLIISQPCRPLENSCEILLAKSDGNIKLHLQFKAPPSYQRLLPITLESSEATFENISIQMLIGGKKMPSEKMKLSEDKKYWEAQLLPFATVTNNNLSFRLIVTYKSELYFAEFPVSY